MRAVKHHCFQEILNERIFPIKVRMFYDIPGKYVCNFVELHFFQTFFRMSNEFNEV